MASESLKPLHNFEDIEGEWIEKLLSVNFGAPITVHSWKTRIPSGREGFLSEIAFLEVTYSKGDNSREDLKLVLKILPKDPEIKEFLKNGNLAKREIEFYKFITSEEVREISSESGIVLPLAETFLALYQEDAITLVLRDLGVDKCKSIIVKDGSTLSQTKVALEAVSRVHAAGLIFMKKHGIDHENLEALAPDFSTDFYSQFMTSNLNTLVDMTKGSSVSKSLKALIPLEKFMFTYHKRYPLVKTVVHGDLWAGQLLNTENEKEAYVIDWQFCRVENPVIDLVAMFFMSSNPEVLELHMEEILSCYWESLNRPLRSAGITLDVTYDDFRKNVDDLLMFGFAILAVSIHDFRPAGNISDKRILGDIEFLEKRNVFKKFLDLYNCEMS